jgi:hypothetical protein
MKKNLKILSCCLAASLAMTAASAHGGVQRVTGSALITLYQSPISPFIGEPVRMTFALTGKDGAALADREVKLTLTDTFTGDESRDRVVLEKTYRTDANGDLEFDQTFPNPDYFDIDLSFLDPVSGQGVEGGFLVQPRQIPSTNVPLAEAAAAGFLAGFAVALAASILRKRWKTRKKIFPLSEIQEPKS